MACARLAKVVQANNRSNCESLLDNYDTLRRGREHTAHLGMGWSRLPLIVAAVLVVVAFVAFLIPN
jgi:hypothetical protein